METTIIHAGPGIPLKTDYAGQRVLCTYDTREIRELMEKIGKEKRTFALPPGYHIEFMNTDRYSERDVVGKICKSPELVKSDSVGRAATVIMFLSEYIHGVTYGKRQDLNELALRNAKDAWKRLINND